MSTGNTENKKKIDWAQVAGVTLIATGVALVGATIYYGAKRTAIHQAGVNTMNNDIKETHENLLELIKEGTVKVYQSKD